MRALISAIILFAAVAASAVEPDEVLQDSALEERARSISQLLRCLVCRNETIDESNAPLAKDLRIVVREVLTEGKSDNEVIEHVVARYGEFVLFRPVAEGVNWLLYLAGPVLFALASLLAVVYLRKRGGRAGIGDGDLGDEDRKQLEQLMRQGESFEGKEN